jgi:hypothetical protein
MTEATDALLERVDRLTVILELALSPQLAAARSALREDPVSAAIFDLLGSEWIASASLQKTVAARTARTTRTVRERLGELADRGLIETQGAGRSTEYRGRGVI